MKSLFIIAIAVLVATSAVAQDVQLSKCPIVPDPAGLWRPPVILFTAAYKFSDQSTAVVARLACRDNDAVLLWIWQVGSCNGPCQAATSPATTFAFWLPRDVLNICEGCLWPRRRAAINDFN